MKKQFNNIGLLVKDIKAMSGLTTTQFIQACDLNMSAQFLGEIMKGKANMPIKKQINIARAMDVDRIEFQGAGVNDFIENFNRVGM